MSRNKILFGLLLCVMFIVGISGGYWVRQQGGVVLRVGQNQNEIDYDLHSALQFLTYRLEQAGKKVAGVSYNGDLYPEKFNNAKVNVFVRGYRPFFDLRMGNNAKNIFYVHRTPAFYREEMRNFDGYLTSQKSMFEKTKDELSIRFFGGGAVPHDRLEPDYRFDVLYIYEYNNTAFTHLLQTRYNAKLYSGIEFMHLSKAEREKLLAEAKLVVYDVLSPESDIGDNDKWYVPYAVYDIISYGRPVLTDYREELARLFGSNVFMYADNFADRSEWLKQVLQMNDKEREDKAAAARERLLGE